MSALAAAVVLLCLSVTVAADGRSGGCSDYYEVAGQLVGPTGKPVAEARVHLLLDRISKKQYRKQGVRAVTTRSRRNGHYTEFVDCKAAAPNPCARRPKELTVFVESGSSLQLTAFKLRDLEVEQLAERCLIRVPPITVKRARF